MKTIIVNKKEVSFNDSEVEFHLLNVIVLINLFGKPYWDEVKKVYDIHPLTKKKIDKVFDVE